MKLPKTVKIHVFMWLTKWIWLLICFFSPAIVLSGFFSVWISVFAQILCVCAISWCENEDFIRQRIRFSTVNVSNLYSCKLNQCHSWCFGPNCYRIRALVIHHKLDYLTSFSYPFYFFGVPMLYLFCTMAKLCRFACMHSPTTKERKENHNISL